MKVVLADDEGLFRGALATLLELHGDVTVVAQVADGKAAVSAVRLHRPDVVLLDLEMPELDGVAAAEALSGDPDVAVVLVTRHARPGVLRRALAAGVQGFVPKSTPAEKILDILREVQSGGRYIDPDIAASALTEGPCPLTGRELDVLRIAYKGGSVTQIAEEIHLSPGTVRNYLSSCMAKLGASTRYEAARMAYEQGWF